MSTATHETDKHDLLERAAEVARAAAADDGPPADEVSGLLRGYYRGVAPEDLLDRADVDVWGALVEHYRLAAHRPQGTAQVRVLTPTSADDGWSAGGRTVVEVVAADMPYLVDSLTMELSRQRRDLHLVIHPMFDVERDVAGALRRVVPVEDGAAAPAAGLVRESWMHVEIDRLPDPDPEHASPHAPRQESPHESQQLVADVRRVLRDVEDAVEDAAKLHERARAIAAALRASPPSGTAAAEAPSAADLLDWLDDEHFTFLGYREYALQAGPDGGEDALRAIPGSGLGILRSDPPGDASRRLPAPVRARAREPHVLVLAKANARSTVHRPGHLDYVGVKTFGPDGEVTGEQRFLGLFTHRAYSESLQRIPVVRDKVAEVLRRSAFDPRSHAGQALLATLETYPRTEVFHTPTDELVPLVEAAMAASERRALRVFCRRDTYERYVSALVYLPRDRYNTAVRERFSAILAERLGAGEAEGVEFTVRLDESTTARVHFVVRSAPGASAPELDAAAVAELERRLTEASRSWRDDFADAVVAEYGEQVGAILGRRYADSFPEAYKEDFPASAAAVDLGRLEGIVGADGVDHRLEVGGGAEDGGAGVRLKLYRIGEPLSLSQLLPMLSSMGVEVVDERPYALTGLERPSHVYEFGLRYPGRLPDEARELFGDALRAVWDGYTEIDGFNALVLGARLTWRQATLLRAYAKYLRQGGSPFAQDYIEEALAANPDITRALVALFETRFDPDRFGGTGADADWTARTGAVEKGRAGIEAALDDVASLDHDRILRAYLALVQATWRTTYFQHADADQGEQPGHAGQPGQPGRPKVAIAFKLDPTAIPDLPEPRPRYEIFVYAPRVEGVHLRFGSVARGGLRWSDRRDDFRTEVLGLVKAQMVKNTVIVPVGAKGGFFAKQLPDPTVDREAWLAEGVACYTTFVSALLDVTDNRVDGATVPPPRVVRHDGDDSYLVVAADKGTATFSDLANGVAADHGFWLGDAFASGGSVGYDHKAMGITARGAWVSVQRHFREMGVDCQSEDFTCVGIGDMSGDVFGNGLLCSPHTRLVAAFDHRHVFLDPDPDPATSFAERQRLFDLPRSSWADYDTTLISDGGGVFARSLKSVPITEPVRRALGLDDDVAALTPSELMRAILLAPVDLLWNGGIGTYVKGSAETHADAGDKANDAIRVDGRDLRVRCVGEGGNLGLTQAGRVEFARLGGPEGADGARAGGRINTDFIDNSAGVDTSDHEVNIKILLDRVVAAGDLSTEQRNAVLAEMTDEVGALVLRDNYEQNLALANADANAVPLLHVHEYWMKRLESDGVLDRALEGLPSSREVARRLERNQGLSQPELSVLLAWTKIVLADELIASDLPDDPYLDLDLRGYFPGPVREGFGAAIEDHPLRREIIVTQVVGDLVNGAGMTYWPRLAGETGASAAELTRANFVAREIFGSLPLRDQIAALDNQLPADVQTRMRLEMRTLVERASRWLVTSRRAPLDSAGLVEAFAEPVQALMGRLPELLVGVELAAFEERRTALLDDAVPADLAARVAALPASYQLLTVTELAATRRAVEPVDVARVHLALGERIGMPMLQQRVFALPRDDRWQTMARATLRDDLQAVHADLTAQVLDVAGASGPGADGGGSAAPLDVEPLLAAWEQREGDLVDRTVHTLRDICADESADLARMSVGLRVVRGLLA